MERDPPATRTNVFDSPSNLGYIVVCTKLEAGVMKPDVVIFRLIGYGLIILGGASGLALFLRASLGREKISQGPGMSTLWGLFITGLAAGVLLITGAHYLH